MNKEKFRNAPWPLKVLFFASAALAYIFVFSALVYFLWNAILPKVSALREINYWQAMGILLLSKILFSSMSFGKHKEKRRHMRKWKDNWQAKTTEEKEQAKARWKAHCEKKTES